MSWKCVPAELAMIRLTIGVLLLLIASLAAEAQQTGVVYRIGCIPAGPLEPRKHQWDAFRRSLRLDRGPEHCH
jgi:hypothetical protein